MLQASDENFQKRRIELEVLYGKKITTSSKTTEIGQALCEYLKATKKIEVHVDFCLNLCAVCELQWETGDFAKEKLLLIPKPNQHSTDKPKPVPVRVTIPRVVCASCSLTLSNEDGLEIKESIPAYTFSEAWRKLLGVTIPKVNVVSSLSHEIDNPLVSLNQSAASKNQDNSEGFDQCASNRSPPLQEYGNSNCRTHTSQQQQLDTAENSRQGENSGTVTPTSENNSSSSGGESLQSMVDQKGFLVCTQLVKTGGADLAGLKAGDIFTQFGNITKENFVGLKSVANFVRGSANKSFQAVVLRRVVEGNQHKKRGATFHKIRLHLTPLYCHDADGAGGGVLGAVMNVYPLPSSDVQTQE